MASAQDDDQNSSDPVVLYCGAIMKESKIDEQRNRERLKKRRQRSNQQFRLKEREAERIRKKERRKNDSGYKDKVNEQQKINQRERRKRIKEQQAQHAQLLAQQAQQAQQRAQQAQQQAQQELQAQQPLLMLADVCKELWESKGDDANKGEKSRGHQTGG